MRLGLLNCGGTITERYKADGGLDRLTASELADRAGMGDAVTWLGHDVEIVDSCDLTLASICRVRDVIRQDQESQAFVMCCGTDAMEDAAFAAALLLDRDRPVVLTGSALPGGESGTDGLANLRDAALLAGAMAPGIGPLVVFAGRVFDPTEIVKIAPQAMQPFGPETAIRGRIEAGLVQLTGQPFPVDDYSNLDASDLEAKVAIVMDTFGPVVGWPDVSALDGLVLAGKGAGGFSGTTRDILASIASKLPVVLSTRAPQGFRVNSAVEKHAFRQAHAVGLTTEGYEGLNAPKARLRLIAELGRQHAAGRGAR